VRITGYTQIVRRSVDALKMAVCNSPVVAEVDALSSLFQAHRGEVITQKECGQNNYHKVLITGYGNLNGQPYWLVKNSWGRDWGLDGYGRIAMTDDGQCGVLNNIIIPNIQ